jgi:hypothetical protein
MHAKLQSRVITSVVVYKFPRDYEWGEGGGPFLQLKTRFEAVWHLLPLQNILQQLCQLSSHSSISSDALHH